MNIILFGFKGCGKTHFGKRLAKQMRRRFIDTDDTLQRLYEKETGERLSVRELHAKLKETLFRSLEKRALLSLKMTRDAVIALGGGAVLEAENIPFLQTLGSLVYLHASTETLKKRMFNRGTPSFLDGEDKESSFLQMIHERTPIYASIPARRIDVDQLDEAGILAALQSILILEEPPNGF